MIGVAARPLGLAEWLARMNTLYGGPGFGVDLELKFLEKNCDVIGERAGWLLPPLEDPTTNYGLARSAARLRMAASDAFAHGDAEVQLSVKRLHRNLRAIVEAVAKRG